MDVIDATNHIKNYEAAIPILTGASANSDGPVSPPDALLTSLPLLMVGRVT